MRHLTLLALLAFTLGTTAAPTVAGQGKPQTEPDASTTSQVTIKLSESEIADFEKLFSEWMKKNDIETRHALSTAVSEYAKSHAKGPKPESDGEVDDSGSPLKDIEAWQGIFKRHFVDELKRKPGGRVAEEELEIRPRGQLYLFEYAYRLPKGYDEHESWPVILCIPDRETDGKNYLKKVWEADKASKDLADKFILVAPTVGEKSIKGSVRGDRAEIARLDWFTSFHAMAMLNPLFEVMGQFNCDPSRIYLEGLGPGGEAAAQLAALYGDIFAAVAVRNGYPRKPELTSGMERVPTMFLMREGSELTTAGRKAFFDDMMKRAKDVGIENDIKIVTLPALEKVTPKDMAGCAVEPLLDATDDVVAFLEPHRLVSYPDTIRVTTNDRNFSKRAWVRLRRFEVGDGDTVVDLKGKIDKKTNTIELEAENVFAFTFFLNDVLLDLDRPVTVMVNGRTAYIGTVERKLETMLDDYRTYPFLTHRSYSASLLVEVKEEALAPETPKEDGQGAGEEAGGK